MQQLRDHVSGACPGVWRATRAGGPTPRGRRSATGHFLVIDLVICHLLLQRHDLVLLLLHYYPLLQQLRALLLHHCVLPVRHSALFLYLLLFFLQFCLHLLASSLPFGVSRAACVSQGKRDDAQQHGNVVARLLRDRR